MYFEITEDVVTDLVSENLECLVNLLDTYKQGNHILAFENRKGINKLINCFSGSIEEKILYHIYSKHQENKALKKKINVYVKVMPHSSEMKRSLSPENKTVFEVPISYFDTQVFATSLVTEDTEDGVFYRGLAERICSEKIFEVPKTILLQATNDSGGGSQIKTVFMNKAQIEKRLTFSICDSDKTSSNSALGSTARSLKTILAKIANENICDALILNVREKENLVTPDLYIQHDDYKNKEGLKLLVKLAQKESLEELRYLKISGKCEETLNFFKEKQGIDIEHTDYSVGKNGLSQIAREFIYTVDFLKKIRQSCKRNKGEHIHYLSSYDSFFSQLPDELIQEYNRIFVNYMSWTCAYPKPRFAT
ncbi:hypothetical protein [Lactococcus garvieae]|uniref:hypothetical protein n=1 Tax=Lactococcus garvieae TaxID=1363 RepID=UPI00254E7ACE|nr:hypothetical protein [Lactococcus garvieae]